MTGREAIRRDVVDVVQPGSMKKSEIVADVVSAYDHPERAVKLEVVKMITDGVLEEHGEIRDHYRVPPDVSHE